MTSIKNFVDVGDVNAPIGSPAWCKAAHVQLCATKRKTDLEVKHLKYDLLVFKKHEHWRTLRDNKGKPFRSWDQYVKSPEPNGLGIPVESAQALMEALDDALIGKVLGKSGGDRRSKEARARADQGGNATLKPNEKNTKAHILARLDRDGFDDLAAQVRAGELSANAAAIEAGFRKKRVHRCPNCGHEF